MMALGRREPERLSPNGTNSLFSKCAVPIGSTCLPRSSSACRKELLFLLEPVRREFQRAAILGDGADDIFRCPRLNLRLDFEGDFDGRSHEPSKMGDHLIGDTACIAAYTSRIETYA